MSAPIDSPRALALSVFAKEAYVYDPSAQNFGFSRVGFARAIASITADDILRVCYEISARRAENGVSIVDPSPIVMDPVGRPSGNVSDARIGDLYAVASTGAIDSLQPQELYVLIAELNAQRALDPVVMARCPTCSFIPFPVPVNMFTLGTAPH